MAPEFAMICIAWGLGLKFFAGFRFGPCFVVCFEKWPGSRIQDTYTSWARMQKSYPASFAVVSRNRIQGSCVLVRLSKRV